MNFVQYFHSNIQNYFSSHVFVIIFRWLRDLERCFDSSLCSYLCLFFPLSSCALSSHANCNKYLHETTYWNKTGRWNLYSSFGFFSSLGGMEIWNNWLLGSWRSGFARTSFWKRIQSTIPHLYLCVVIFLLLTTLNSLRISCFCCYNLCASTSFQ